MSLYCESKCTDIWYQKEKESTVTRFYLDPCDLNKWMHQNDVIPIAFVDGCLQDNMLFKTKRGYAAVYEHYVNEWSSDFYIEFQPGAANDVFNAWYEFIDKLEDENNEI